MNEMDRAREALTFIPPSCERDTWFRVMAGGKSLLGEHGRDLLDEWSQGAPDSYSPVDFASTWKSIQEGGAITGATLYGIAKEHGWTPQGSERRTAPTLEELEKREAARKCEAARIAQQQATAARKAHAAWTAGARGTHPYLERKGVKPTGTMRIIRAEQLAQILGYEPKAGDAKLTGLILLLPIKVGDALSSLEMIDAAGRKSALYGGRKSGGIWSASKLPEGDGAGLTIQVAEGAATALSGFEAMAHPSIAALSSHNLKPAALAMRARYPRGRIVILGDIGNGENQANDAALAVDGFVAVPNFGAGPPLGAKDWNDLHQMKGLEAVKTGLHAARRPTPLPEPQSIAEKRPGAILGDEWGEPEPIGRTDKPDAYPIEELPGIVGRAVHEAIAESQCPPALAAHAALCAISTACMGLANVKRTETLVSPIGLYLLILCESGERKTHVDRLFMRGIEEWESETQEMQRAAMREFLGNKDVWQATREGLLTKIKRASERGTAQ